MNQSKSFTWVYEHLAHKIVVAQCRNAHVWVLYKAQRLFPELGKDAPGTENLKKYGPWETC